MFPTVHLQETRSIERTRHGCREEGTFAFCMSLCFIIRSAEVIALRVKHENLKILLFQFSHPAQNFPCTTLADENLTCIFYGNALQFYKCLCKYHLV